MTPNPRTRVRQDISMPTPPTRRPKVAPTSKKRAIRRLSSGPTHSRDLLVPRSVEVVLARAVRELTLEQPLRGLLPSSLYLLDATASQPVTCASLPTATL